MHQISLLLSCLLCTCVRAQNIEVVDTETEDGYNIAVANHELVPVSVTFDFELNNLTFRHPVADTIVLPPQSRQTVIHLVQQQKGKGYGYSHRYRYNYGDYRVLPYDTAFVYQLPFAAGKPVRIIQGYDGGYSHQGKAALDFNLPEGTPVYAARGGKVIRVVDSFDRRCMDQACAKYNNYVTVLHSDGTYGEYTHLRKDGSAVTVGEEVNTGDLLAYSGNTGYSSGPHLHFAVYRQRFDRRDYVPTVFAVAGQAEPVQLVEGGSYGR